MAYNCTSFNYTSLQFFTSLKCCVSSLLLTFILSNYSLFRSYLLRPFTFAALLFSLFDKVEDKSKGETSSSNEVAPKRIRT